MEKKKLKGVNNKHGIKGRVKSRIQQTLKEYLWMKSNNGK